jgi:hypothetical protein
MKSFAKSWLAVALLVAATSMAFAQGPLHKRINYTINVDHALRMGDYLLPPGQYVLFEINENDPNLFALYRDDMTHAPIAMIRTVRIDYSGSRYPGQTKMLLDIDEASSDLHPVIHGWNIPGEDGWQIISVVAKDKGVMTRVK